MLRQRLPRDLVVLGRTSRQDWAKWRARLRTLARWRSVLRLPFVVVCGAWAAYGFAEYTSGVAGTRSGRGVRRLLRAGDHCVLLCAGDGTALHTLGQFARRISRARVADQR